MGGRGNRGGHCATYRWCCSCDTCQPATGNNVGLLGIAWRHSNAIERELGRLCRSWGLDVVCFVSGGDSGPIVVSVGVLADETVMKRKAWEVVGGDRGGWDLFDRSMEATGCHANGGGKGVTGAGVGGHNGGL